MDRKFQETCQKMNELKSQLSSSNNVENPYSCNITKRDSIVATVFQLEKLHQVNSAVANQNIDWIKSNFFIDVSGVYAGENSDWQPSMIFRVIDNVIGIDFLTCVKNQGNLLRNRDDTRKSLDSLKEIKSLKEVLDVSAIVFLNDVGVKIIQTGNMPEDTAGSYTKMSGVKLEYSQAIFDSSLKSVLIHELWHQSMSNVFMNNNNPYKSDDQKMKAVYEEAIVKTLQKLGEAICPKNFDYNRSDSNALGKAIYNECYDVESENDFLTDFYDSPVYRCYNNIPHPSIDSVVESFMMVYSDFYQEHSSHAEFIVRYEELIARGFSDNELEILSPLKEFIDSYIKPAMREYVNTHPLREYLIDQNTSPDGTSILVKQDPEIIQQLAWCAENNL